MDFLQCRQRMSGRILSDLYVRTRNSTDRIEFGPVMLFGLGGIMVEIFQDVSLRLLPLTREDAVTMVREIKGYGLIAGYRGRPPVDEQALADCLLAVARVAEEYPEIVEIDLNPVFAYPDGILVADSRIIVN